MERQEGKLAVKIKCKFIFLLGTEGLVQCERAKIPPMWLGFDTGFDVICLLSSLVLYSAF